MITAVTTWITLVGPKMQGKSASSGRRRVADSASRMFSKRQHGPYAPLCLWSGCRRLSCKGLAILMKPFAVISLLFAAFAVAADVETHHPQSDLESVLKGDPRNTGVEVSARYRTEGSLLIFDLKSIEPTNSMADVFRVLLQFAQAEEKGRAFTSVELAFRGNPGSF